MTTEELMQQRLENDLVRYARRWELLDAGLYEQAVEEGVVVEDFVEPDA